MSWLNFFWSWSCLQTFRFAHLTSCCKRTAFWQIDGAWDIAFQNASFLLVAWVRNWNCRQQCLSIWMGRILVVHFLWSCLYNKTQIHNRNAVRDHLNNRQVVGDEHIGQVKFLLKLMQKVKYLCLNRNVQRRDRLVSDISFGRTVSALAIPIRCF